MNRPSTTDSTDEVTMHPSSNRADRRAQRGQIIVVAALTMIAIIGGVSLILEGGNAYAHQRMAQNAADSVANAGATILAQRLGGGLEGDAEVIAATDAMAAANHLDTYKAYYTNLTGGMLTPLGAVTTDPALAEQVGPADAATRRSRPARRAYRSVAARCSGRRSPASSGSPSSRRPPSRPPWPAPSPAACSCRSCSR